MSLQNQALQNQALILDLIEWLGPAPRPYPEVMAAWRTSCPRLTIWEDALDAGLVTRRSSPDGAPMVAATRDGLDFLARLRPAGSHS